MSQQKAIETNGATDTGADLSPYVPPLQVTKGQPAPIAANGGLSYMSFDRNGDSPIQIPCNGPAT